MITLKIPGKEDKPPVEFLTISELALELGRTRYALDDLVDAGIMPNANYRTKSTVAKRGPHAGTPIEGYRLYSRLVLTPMLKEIFQGIKQGTQITIEQRQKLVEAFEFEKNFFTKKY